MEYHKIKYSFDNIFLNFLNLKNDMNYSETDMINYITDNSKSWRNLDGKFILNKQLLDVIKFKYPKDSDHNYNYHFFHTSGYWKNQIENGFSLCALKEIVNSCIIHDNMKMLNIDKGNNISTLII